VFKHSICPRVGRILYVFDDDFLGICAVHEHAAVETYALRDLVDGREVVPKRPPIARFHLSDVCVVSCENPSFCPYSAARLLAI
jgi:hypothetical protein